MKRWRLALLLFAVLLGSAYVYTHLAILNLDFANASSGASTTTRDSFAVGADTPTTTAPPALQQVTQPQPAVPTPTAPADAWGTGNSVAPQRSQHAPSAAPAATPAAPAATPTAAGKSAAELWGTAPAAATPAAPVANPFQAPASAQTQAPTPASSNPFQEPAKAAAGANPFQDSPTPAAAPSANPFQEPAKAASSPAAPATPTPTPPAPIVAADAPLTQLTPSSGPMAKWAHTGRAFPIVVMACNREKMLRGTLESLLQVKRVSKDNIYVIQDGRHAPVEQVIKDFGLKYEQHGAQTGLRRGRPQDGAARIAQHYGYALGRMFDHYEKQAPAIVVLEDDFKFAPDLMEYFMAVSAIVEEDDSLWLASAWNDNGFATHVRDANALKRTNFFPGLGWLLPRQVWQDELQSKWPTEHWDHWMRSPKRHRNRHIVFPEVPRDYHMGIKGTFMDERTHNKYFASIFMNKDPQFSWATPKAQAALQAAKKDAYFARLRSDVSQGTHMRTVPELERLTSGVGIVWIDVSLAANNIYFKPVSKYFGIWHEPQRGSVDGVHEFWWTGTSRLVLINVAVNKDLAGLRPANIVPFQGTSFSGQVPPERVAMTGVGNEAPRAALAAPAAATAAGGGGGGGLRGASTAAPGSSDYTLHAAPKPGMSCDQVCGAKGLACQAQWLSDINTCSALKSLFNCLDCEVSEGGDQPAYIAETAPGNFHPQRCLTNADPALFSCAASFKHTHRLCPCA